MPKTITLRIDEDVYGLFKIAASAEKRTISNLSLILSNTQP